MKCDCICIYLFPFFFPLRRRRGVGGEWVVIRHNKENWQNILGVLSNCLCSCYFFNCTIFSTYRKVPRKLRTKVHCNICVVTFFRMSSPVCFYFCQLNDLEETIPVLLMLISVSWIAIFGFTTCIRLVVPTDVAYLC